MEVKSVRLSDQKEPNFDLCIICQKKTRETLVSGEEGRKKVLAAAQLRQDDVYSHILLLSDQSKFKYHKSYPCYLKYISIIKYKNETVESESDKEQYDDQNIGSVNENIELTQENVDNDRKENQDNLRNSKQVDNIRVTRSMTRSNKKKEDLTRIKCIICDTINLHNDCKKSRITEVEKAGDFLQMTQSLKDEVYSRTAQYKTPYSIIQSGVYYHAQCMRQYKLKFERIQAPVDPPVSSSCLSTSGWDSNNENDEHNTRAENIVDSKQLIVQYIKSLEQRFLGGEAFELSAITSSIKSTYAVDQSLNNRFVKTVLIDLFGENVHFSYPKQRNKSILVYYSKLSVPEIVDNIRTLSESPVKNCALLLKNELKSTDFHLTDRYCDEHDLRSSWNKFKVPENFVEFFSILFNIDASRINVSNTDLLESNDTDAKVLKIKYLFQIIYYTFHNARQRTPLHIATGLSVHHTTKSKAVITCLNRLGVSISYAEVERYRTGLAAYAARSAEILIPIPSHFNTNVFTTAAFDNFDYEGFSLSGFNGTHDTVSVLFQQKSEIESNLRKPDVLDCNDHKKRSFTNSLKCQLKKNFVRPQGKIELPKNFSSIPSENIVTVDSFKRIIQSEDLAWFLCRIDVNSDENFCIEKNQQNTPSWSAFHSLLSNDHRPCTQTGFLPVLPHPVTEFDTVYTALSNFNEVLQQLQQGHLPIFCDEGVYKIARLIKFMKEEEMKNLVIMLGSFHTEKILYACVGRYLEDSGIKNILIETNLFGLNVAEGILNGAHYSRCVKAYFIISEALTRLQLQAFFTSDSIEKHDNELQIIDNLRNALSEGSIDEAKSLLKLFNDSSRNLTKDFEDFVQRRSEESPLFRYWNNVLIMIDIVQNYHRADRSGDWKLHIETLKKQQPLFHVFDRLNYARFCTLYLEDCLKIETDTPELYNKFLQGFFTVKQTSNAFSSVATDQALEQTINKSAKSTSGIIGTTNKKNYVASWDIIFHEIMGINNFYREINGLGNDNEELKIHHEFNISNTQLTEESVRRLVDFFQKRDNPFQDGCQPLRDIVTGQLVDEKVAVTILDVFKIGCDKFYQFRKERILSGEKSLSDTIHRTNFPTFSTVPIDKSTKKINKKNVHVHQSLRIVDIARERNYDIKKLLSFDLSPLNMLFDKDGLMKKEKNKSDLIQILEKKLDAQIDYSIPNVSFSIVVDVMLYCRKIKWKNLKNFNDFAETFCAIIAANTRNREVSRIDFVFNDYFENSIKTSERIRRSKEEAIEIHEISAQTPLPNQENKFWSSHRNKEKLQKFLRTHLLINHDTLWPQTELVFSTMQSLECVSSQAHLKNDPSMLNLQRFDLEEADLKIILHIHDCCMEKKSNILILSADTDILTLALNFFSTFKSLGLQELWMRVGTGDKIRNIPIHTLADRWGQNVCQSLIAAHHLTGSDYTSKVGTKSSAIRANPDVYLLNFGRDSSNECEELSIEKAETYLLNVLQKNSSFKNFNDFRYSQYHHSLHLDIENLPPTSATIQLHIRRALYVTYLQINCLYNSVPELDPTLYGFEYQNSLLVPRKVITLLPPIHDFVPSCHCKVCTRTTCCCVNAKIECCSFCLCHKSNTCKNKYNQGQVA